MLIYAALPETPLANRWLIRTSMNLGVSEDLSLLNFCLLILRPLVLNAIISTKETSSSFISNVKKRRSELVWRIFFYEYEFVNFREKRGRGIIKLITKDV